MEKAFTIIEIIFVITIMGILAGIAKANFPDNRLQTDSEYIIQKIKEKQFFALNYNHHDFSNPNWDQNYYETTCITIDKNSLQNESNSVKKYTLSSKTKINIDAAFQKICFDNIGRPYKNNYLLNNLLKMPIKINIEYENRTKQISVLPFSGYISK